MTSHIHYVQKTFRPISKELIRLMFSFTRFVGTQQGVLKTYPGLRLQKTYSHQRQSWSVNNCLTRETIQRENIH